MRCLACDSQDFPYRERFADPPPALIYLWMSVSNSDPGSALDARILRAIEVWCALAEGEINELHVGLKGTMNALFLKDLAAKTHRGQRGRV